MLPLRCGRVGGTPFGLCEVVGDYREVPLLAALPVQGICYDAGVRYAKDFHSRPHWRPDGVHRGIAERPNRFPARATPGARS